MSTLDGLLPGNRTIKVNGVAAPKGRDTLDFIGPGLGIADLGDRTGVSIPADTLRGLSASEFQIPAFENGNWRVINGRPPLAKSLIVLPSPASDVLIQQPIYTIGGSIADAVQLEWVLVRMLRPLPIHEGGDPCTIQVGFGPDDASIIASFVVSQNTTAIQAGKDPLSLGSAWAGLRLLGLSGGDQIWTKINANSGTIAPAPLVEISLWGFFL